MELSCAEFTVEYLKPFAVRIVSTAETSLEIVPVPLKSRTGTAVVVFATGVAAPLDVAPGGTEPGLFPSAGGTRFWLFTVRANEAQTGHALHRTSTIDLGFIVAGVLTLELEDGTMVDLHPGDAYVQNGTQHGWHNHGDVDAVVALVVLGR